MRIVTVAALGAAGILAAGAVGPVLAAAPSQGCTAAPESQWLSMEQLKSDVAAQGFVVWKGRITGSCAEIAAYPSNTGALEKLRVDPATGRIVEVR